MVKFYLAHPLNSRHEVRAHEIRIETECPDIQLMNPFYDFDRDDIKDIDNGKTTRWELTYERCEDLVENDINSIIDCDGIVAVLDKGLSCGTFMEIVYARVNNKKIIVLDLNGMKNHPWIRVHADKVITSWDEVSDAIDKVMG